MKFSTVVTYTSDAARISALRPRHRDYLAKLHASGQLILAGPFTDDSGALFIHEAESREQVATFVAADPFAEGIFRSVDTRPWKLVFVTASALAA